MRGEVFLPACLFTVYKLLSFLCTAPENSRDHDNQLETDSALLITNISKYGKPSFLKEIKKSGYHILYNTLTKSPVYVIEKLTKDTLVPDPGADRSGIPFTKDQVLRDTESSSNADFVNSGFDRGHLAAAGNHSNCGESLAETFSLSNMCPQFPVCNRGNWKVLENHARSLALEHGIVYVYSGPIYIPQSPPNMPHDKYVIYKVIGNNSVAVPTHFFKVVVIEVVKGRNVVESYVVENAPQAKPCIVGEMRVELADVEKWSGLHFDKLHKFV